MKILNFGSCNIDHVYSLDHFVRAGETVSSRSLSHFVGGKGLNQSVAVAKSGVPVCHAGCIGKDGEMLRNALISAGVDDRFLKTVDAPTGHAIIQVNEKGENCIIIHSGANGMIDRAFVEEVLSHYEAGDILMLQNEINDIEYIIDCAFEKGLRIVLNPSPFEEKLKDIDLSKLYAILINETEGREMTGKGSAEEIIEYFRSRYESLKVVLTLGSDGCVYFDCASGERVSHPIFYVPVADTTSAGDTFTGYYLSGLVRGLSPREILRMASAASAIAVSRAGASVSIPTYDEVQAALSTVWKE